MSAPRAAEVLLDWLPRIEAAARELADVEEMRAAAIRRRDELIVGAADDGVSQKAIAAAAHVSQPRVIKILSTPHAAEPDDD